MTTTLSDSVSDFWIAINVRTCFSVELISGDCGESMEELWHHLVIADLRARFGISVEKSGMVPSERFGVKFKFLQASTDTLSKVWPEETITGSAIRDPETGHRNSSGSF